MNATLKKHLLKDPREFAVCMGMDAFRLCLGMKPRNFTRKQVIDWLTALSSTSPAEDTQK